MATSTSPDPARDPASTLTAARTVVGALAVAPPALAVVTEFVDLGVDVQFLVAPAALLGIVNPVIGYRLYALMAERAPAGVSIAEGCRRFLRANLAAVAVSESIALLGIVAYALSGRLVAMIGVLTHVILVGAIWPSEQGLQQFTHREPEEGRADDRS